MITRSNAKAEWTTVGSRFKKKSFVDVVRSHPAKKSYGPAKTSSKSIFFGFGI